MTLSAASGTPQSLAVPKAAQVATGGSPTAPGMQQDPRGRSRIAEISLPRICLTALPHRESLSHCPQQGFITDHSQGITSLTFLSLEDEQQAVPVQAGWGEFDLAGGFHSVGSVFTHCLP